MINADILRFIKSRLHEGMSQENISRLLITEGGWSRSDVEEAFAIVDNEIDSTHRTDASVKANYLSSTEEQEKTTPQPPRRHDYDAVPQPGIHTANRSQEPEASSTEESRIPSYVPLIFGLVFILLVLAGLAAILDIF